MIKIKTLGYLLMLIVGLLSSSFAGTGGGSGGPGDTCSPSTCEFDTGYYNQDGQWVSLELVS
jgi:hypothetical protein